MAYLQDKNHFTALTAEALLVPPWWRTKYLRLVGQARPPRGGPHLHARSFPNRALEPKRGKQNLIFMVN